MSLLPKDAAARKAIPLYSGLVKYFPDALAGVARVSYQGNRQHHPDKPLHWDKSKSADEADALLRHLFDYTQGIETEDGVDVLGKVCWRALALYQRAIEAKKSCES